MWEFAEVIIGAIVCSFLGAALYRQAQQVMPIVIGFIKWIAKRFYRRITKGWLVNEPKEESKTSE